MVNDPININHGEMPPPMDEAWWSAVLAEDEAGGTSDSSRTVQHSERSSSNEDQQGSIDETEPDWEVAAQLYEQDQVVKLDVSGCNRGGLLVQGENLNGFVPISHLVEMPCDPNNAENDLEQYINKTLLLKIIECDQERGRVVFSERAALAEPGSRKQLLDSLEPGNCISGKVTNITDFGVFVDLGGVEGLVHVSEISWGRVHHPTDVVSIGEEVTVYVIQIDKERARVALSLKRLYPNPWETAQTRYHTGQVTDAIVTSIVPFGAFARLEEGLDGLIHVSEIPEAGQETFHPDNPLTEGQVVKVRVIHVDAKRQRLGLSLDLDAYE